MLKKLFKNKDLETWKRIAFWCATVFVGLFAMGLIVVASAIAILSIGLPDVNDLERLTPPESTQILDRNGKLLYTIHGEENREQIDLSQISENLIKATVAIEDDSFWTHSGFDFKALGKVVGYEIFGIGTPRGGSTITQQYVKNAFLSSERTYTRKAKELILSIRLERNFDKEKILELYLNRIPYGNNAYGIQRASERYFNKDASDLTLGESAILASLPQAPSRHNPYGNNKYSHLLKDFTPEELQKRTIETESDLQTNEYVRGLIGQHVKISEGNSVYIAGRSDLVLRRMFELEMITKEERQEALNEIQNIVFNEYRESIRHPHFVLYIKQELEEKYGKDVVENGGMKVYTTIDSDLQTYAEKIAKERGEANLAFGANNIAIFTINSKTGEILTMVGSRDYFNEEIHGNVNVVTRPRQPGSSFKPIAYTQAFYNGYSPGSVIYDVPTKVGPNTPRNFDNTWMGQMTIREALGFSRNIPAVKAYFLAGEQDPIIDLSRKLGITTLSKNHHYGYPLALGAGEVSLKEMVTAFATFANNGKRPEITGILRVESSNGDILEEWEQKQFEEVLDPQIAFLINDILSDKSVSLGARLFIPNKINAVKTGTSTKEEGNTGKSLPGDGWTIGYTPTITTGVWAGNTDGKGMNQNASGYSVAAPAFNAVMTKALEGMASEPFPEPEGIKRVQISKASGKLPGANTPSAYIVTEVFASFAVPTEVEDLFYTVTLDRISGLLATEFTPPSTRIEVSFQKYEPIADLFNWKEEIRRYYQNLQSEDEDQDKEIRIGSPPTEYDNVHTAETAQLAPTIRILNPFSQGTISHGTNPIDLDISAPHGIERVEIFLDNSLKYTSTSEPFNTFLFIPMLMEQGTKHLLVAKVTDKLGYTSESGTEITLGDTPSSPAPPAQPETPQNGQETPGPENE
jgi:membrane peptidoglycan carboxypeptidase